MKLYGFMMSPYVYAGLVESSTHATSDPSSIFSRVATVFGRRLKVSRDQLLSAKRYGRFMFCRQMIVGLLRDHYNMSYSAIGLYMHRDHSTIINRYRRHIDYLETMLSYRQQYNDIMQEII